MTQAIKEAKQRIRDAERALQTARDNLAFAKLSKADKRVAIAQDVIAQIRLGKINVIRGRYLKNADVEANGDVVTVNKCDACALGSLFACAVTKPVLKLNWNSAVDEIYGADDDEMRTQLEDVFSETQLRLIETAFELDDFTETRDLSNEEGEFIGVVKKAVDFGDRFTDDERRLIKIMENVIKNKGTFKP